LKKAFRTIEIAVAIMIVKIPAQKSAFQFAVASRRLAPWIFPAIKTMMAQIIVVKTMMTRTELTMFDCSALFPVVLSVFTMVLSKRYDIV
jgi:hypothetical protein